MLVSCTWTFTTAQDTVFLIGIITNVIARLAREEAGTRNASPDRRSTIMQAFMTNPDPGEAKRHGDNRINVTGQVV